MILDQIRKNNFPKSFLNFCILPQVDVEEDLPLLDSDSLQKIHVLVKPHFSVAPQDPTVKIYSIV